MKVGLNVGDVFTVAWSNGHGESDYRVTDSVFGASHVFELVAEREFGDGDDDGIDDGDFEALFADIMSRRGAE